MAEFGERARRCPGPPGGVASEARRGLSPGGAFSSGARLLPRDLGEDLPKGQGAFGKEVIMLAEILAEIFGTVRDD